VRKLLRAFSFRRGGGKIAFEVGIPFPVHIVERSAIGGLYSVLLLDTHRDGLFYIPSVWLGVIVYYKVSNSLGNEAKIKWTM
jgi:hypothetical protein